jgi:hypothetical protein
VTTLRRLRRAAAFLAILGVLFSQLAISAYACPGAAAMAAVTVQAMPEMPGCDEAVPTADRSALCHAHCLQGDQSLDKAASALQAMSAALAYPLPERVRVVQSTLDLPRAFDALLDRPTGPPLAVRHCRFHI